MRNWNDWFAYTTTRVVRVKDWRLGSLYYLFVLGIFLYIVLYVLIFQKKYLYNEVPIGTVRLTLQRQSGPGDGSLPYYCGTGNYSPPHNSSLVWDQYPCRFYDANFVVFPPLETAAMFVTSRVNQSLSHLSSDCTIPLQPNCRWLTQESTSYFIPYLEYFTLLIDHSFTASMRQGVNAGFKFNAQSLNGNMIDINGRPVDPCLFTATPCDPGNAPVRVGVAGKPDIVPLGALLAAAGVQSLDDASDALDLAKDGVVGEPHRESGLVVIVTIFYDNTWCPAAPPCGPGDDSTSSHCCPFQYTISARRVSQTEFKVEETISNPFSEYNSNGTVKLINHNRHGIRIVIHQTGQASVVDVQEALITLVTSLGLLAVAATVVDFLSFYIMPDRKLYRTFKSVDSEAPYPTKPGALDGCLDEPLLGVKPVSKSSGQM